MAGLVACAAAAATWLVLDRAPDEATLPRDTPPANQQAHREERLTLLLEQLDRALGREDTASLAAGDGVRQLAAVGHNVARIGFSTLDLRYVAPAEVSGQTLTRSDTWVADVQVTWRFRRYDAARSSLEVPILVRDDGDRARFAGLAGSEEGRRVPLWLLERLAVRKGERTLVAAADGKRLPLLHRLASEAVVTVGKVLPDWRGALVLEEPSSQALLDRAVGADRSVTEHLAGVTTTVDGSVVPGGATHVLLNPVVFRRLGPQAAQIVVSHEATHVATDGAVSGVPQWLAEGFADYVALRDVDLPVSVTAAQILAEVRRDGPPTRLPAPADFSGDNEALGAAYESAWLACRFLAEEYGEALLVAFYRQADAESGTGRAFRTVLGTSEAAFTRSWSSYLARLASSS